MFLGKQYSSMHTAEEKRTFYDQIKACLTTCVLLRKVLTLEPISSGVPGVHLPYSYCKNVSLLKFQYIPRHLGNAHK